VLSKAASGKPYLLRDHPRLEIICRTEELVFLPSDAALPDPSDGQLERDEGVVHHVHACLGCPLLVHSTLLGALTADALDPKAFDGIDLRFLEAGWIRFIRKFRSPGEAAKQLADRETRERVRVRQAARATRAV
jgi:transcriptional regulator with GAF, ATPase, and Fis domain